MAGYKDMFGYRRLSAFWLGKSPGTFKQLYTFAAFILFALRYFIYRSRGCAPLPPTLRLGVPIKDMTNEHSDGCEAQVTLQEEM